MEDALLLALATAEEPEDAASMTAVDEDSEIMDVDIDDDDADEEVGSAEEDDVEVDDGGFDELRVEGAGAMIATGVVVDDVEGGGVVVDEVEEGGGAEVDDVDEGGGACVDDADEDGGACVEDGGADEPEAEVTAPAVVGRGAAAAAAVPRLASPLLAKRTADAVGMATPRPSVGRGAFGSTSQTPAV